MWRRSDIPGISVSSVTFADHLCRHGRGETDRLRSSCEIRVVVTGEGSHAQAKLRATCRSEQLPYLTFAQAIPQSGSVEVKLGRRSIVASQAVIRGISARRSGAFSRQLASCGAR